MAWRTHANSLCKSTSLGGKIMTQEMEIFAGLIFLAQVANAILTLRTLRKEANQPLEDLKQTDRLLQESIGQLRQEVNTMKADLDHAFDKERELEKNNLVLQRGVLALIYHELDGNHTQVLEEAKTELEKVVWHKSK